MRKYTLKYVSTNMAYGRSHTAACPFPGKYPLRFAYMVDDKTSYNGKFHSASWKTFKRSGPVGVCWIYDKAGPVIYGTQSIVNCVSRDLSYRYFGVTMVTESELMNLELKTLGPYRVYVPASAAVVPARYIRYVNTHVAHIRSI